MANRKIVQFTLIGGISIGSFIAGTYYAKPRSGQVRAGLSSSSLGESSSLLRDSGSPVTHSSSLLSLSSLVNFERWKECPGIPIFGVVSAATPFTPSAPGPEHVSRVSQIMKYGFPGMDHIRSFDDFVLSYDRRNKVAHWVFEHLTLDNTKYNEKVDRSTCEFKPDESIHPYFRSQNTDYKKSGYDRGHMAAAGNHKAHQKHVEQTFFLSNMAPQVGVGFNRDSWNRLEKYVRKLTKVYKNVYCCTGPLYLPKLEENGRKYIRYEVIGANNVAVPTHFFKVLVGETAEGHLDMEAYVMPNQVVDNSISLTHYQVSPEMIEKAAGLLFFDNVSKTKLRKINGKQK